MAGPNLSYWRNKRDGIGLFGRPADEEVRAVAAWQRILDKPTTVAFFNRAVNGSNGQTLRVEWKTVSNREQFGGAGTTATTQRVTLFGVKDHPDPDVEDSDIEINDQFVIGDVAFIVQEVVEYPGEIQARCEAQT